ncbi:MAG: tetratricopeptide repeat protein [Massilia sp.]|nr:tetratricopeptide repeat protein [Massilia sp.]
MLIRSISAAVVLATAACCAAPLALAQDATIHQVFQAAEAGKFTEAQAMMDKVLREHPNSGKAHYIEAELLAKQGKFAEARTELANAERLAPGLPFAKPEAVQHLRALAARASAAPPARVAQAGPERSFAREAPAAAPSSGTPWGMILFVAALAALAFAYFRNKAASQASAQRYAQGPGPVASAGGAAYPHQYANAGSVPFGASAAAPAMGPMGPIGAPGGSFGGGMGGGLGAGIVGGLATGAALGAGMVAGSALMHHFTDGNRSAGSAPPAPAAGNDPLSTPDPLFNNAPPLNDDMGGTDFGIADAGSWDDSGGGGDEWN